MTEEKKKRLHFADASKGISVLIIVFYHILESEAAYPMIAGIIPCLLFVLFFYSGYFYSPGKRTFRENMTAKGKSILIPFFKYSLILWAIGTVIMMMRGEIPFPEAILCLRNFYAGCIWNRDIQNLFGWQYYQLGARYVYLADFWFLPAMFFSCILFFPAADAVIDDWKKGITAIPVLLGISGVLCHFRITFAYNLHMIPYWAALMLTGVLVHRYRPIQKGGENRVRGILISLAFLLAGAACSIYFGYGEQLFRGSFSNYTSEIPAMIILYITGLMAALGLSTLLSIMEESGIILKKII